MANNQRHLTTHALARDSAVTDFCSADLPAPAMGSMDANPNRVSVHILNAAIALFKARGYHGASMRELCH